ncbi:sulfatase-like hydrolase/transferase, partial [Pirellulales bacterium]|nr:sulfatase-like hydrolase/transferase [Pirellulales bacterium]
MQSICKTLSVAVIFFSSFIVLAADRKSPNVLIIMADDCTYNDLSLYGGKTAQTPHINQLAAHGLVFDQAYLCEA